MGKIFPMTTMGEAAMDDEDKRASIVSTATGIDRLGLNHGSA
ncbi:MAG: hypothetical protein N2444_02555 [Methylocystis sp.]|nr:hypothetical protein [Methylocystis sp.]